MIKNRKCLTDGTPYSYCPDCSGKDKLAPSWKSEFCCEDCKIIWDTATKYNMKLLTKKEAKEIISAINLKPMDQYTSCVQRDLKAILAEEPKAKRTKKVELPKVDETTIDAITVAVNAEITNITEDEVVVEVEPVTRSKAKTKSHEVVKIEENK